MKEEENSKKELIFSLDKLPIPQTPINLCDDSNSQMNINQAINIFDDSIQSKDKLTNTIKISIDNYPTENKQRNNLEKFDKNNIDNNSIKDISIENIILNNKENEKIINISNDEENNHAISIDDSNETNNKNKNNDNKELKIIKINKERRERRSKNIMEGRTFCCEYCSKSYLSKTSLQNHRVNKHKDQIENLKNNNEIKNVIKEKKIKIKNDNSEKKVRGRKKKDQFKFQIQEELEENNSNNKNDDIPPISNNTISVNLELNEIRDQENQLNLENKNDSDKKSENNSISHKEKNNKQKNNSSKSISIVDNNNLNEIKNDNNNENQNILNKKKKRGRNKCYRIIDEFFDDQKRKKNLSPLINLSENENNNNENSEIKKIVKRNRYVKMSDKFDEFSEFVKEKVNDIYYETYVLPIMTNYKNFYLEKEKDYKKDDNLQIEVEGEQKKENNNSHRKKILSSLKNSLEIPELVNDFIRFLYNKNIFENDDSKIEMVELIFVFCSWLKQKYYTKYTLEYDLNN